MRVIFFSFILVCLNGCSLIINRASFQKSYSDHYIEIYGGGFTSESAFISDLKVFSKLICRDGDYKIKSNSIVSAVNGTLPGMACYYRGCSDHLILKTTIECASTTKTNLTHELDSEARWLDFTNDKDTIDGLLNSDRDIEELIQGLGIPDQIFYNGSSEVIFNYPSLNLSAHILRSLRLTGYMTVRMVIKKDLFEY